MFFLWVDVVKGHKTLIIKIKDLKNFIFKKKFTSMIKFSNKNSFFIFDLKSISI